MAFTDVAASDEIRHNAGFTAKIDGTRLLLTRVDGQVRAIENRCPHLNLPLGRGKIEGSTITCPFHGSSFDVCTGRNLDWITSVAGMGIPDWSRKLIAFGKQPTSVRTFEAREEGGRVLVDLP